MSTKVDTMTISESNTTSLPKLGCNIQSLKTKNGILMILELLISVSCVTMCFKGDLRFGFNYAPTTTILLLSCFIVSTFTTLLLLISCLVSPVTANTIPKTAYVFLNNVFLSLFYLANTVVFRMMVSDTYLSETPNETVVGVIGIVNGLLYLFSSYLSFEAFKSQ